MQGYWGKPVETGKVLFNGARLSASPIAAARSPDTKFRSRSRSRICRCRKPVLARLQNASCAILLAGPRDKNLATGEAVVPFLSCDDPMVTADEMRQIDKSAVVFPSLGHNAHCEKPDAVWRVISEELA